MSQLGYITNNYGKEFRICVANTYSTNVISSTNLPPTSIIIAANTDEDGNDTGTYSLIATDYKGNPVRLTYTISEGNGLYYSSEDDTLSFNINNQTITELNNNLTFNLANILSNDFYLQDNTIKINTNNIPTASKNYYGIAAIDGRTLKLDNDSLYVVTENLNYANNKTGQFGIGIGDGYTVKTNNGHLSLNLSTLNKASKDKYGLIIDNGTYVNINDGIISINTQNLDFASKEHYGISKADNNTIIYDEENNITIADDNLNIATNLSFGIAKIDKSTLSIDKDKVIMKDYNNLLSTIALYKDLLLKYQTKQKEYLNYLAEGNTLLKANDIKLFAINETSVTELIKPKFKEEVIDMPLQTVSVVFDIITTCDFIFNINFEEKTNEFPTVDIMEVNFNDEIIYDKEIALHPDTVYPSTEGKKKKLTIKFLAKNYRDSKQSEYIITSILFTVINSKDNLIHKEEKYSIVRYNSLYEKLENQNTVEYKNDNEYYVLVESSLQWAVSEEDNNI